MEREKRDPAYPITYEADVVVAGAGQGGLSAAISAAEEGANTLLLEVSSKTGGGSSWSGGFITILGTNTLGPGLYEEYMKYTEGLFDPELSRIYVETYRNEWIPWQNKLGAHWTPVKGAILGHYMGKGERKFTNCRRYFDSLESAFERYGGTLLAKTRALKLLTDEEGRVAGIRASSWRTSPLEAGKLFEIKAKAVILAMGSFFNNPEMKQKYIGPWADMAMPMGVPYATGAGLQMAREVGAALSVGMSSFCGLLCPVTTVKPVCADPEAYEKVLEEDPDKLTDLVAHWRASSFPWYGRFRSGKRAAILVNLEGKRFIDEGDPISAKWPRNIQAVLSQRYGRAFMIFDRGGYNTHEEGGYYVSAKNIDSAVFEFHSARTPKALEDITSIGGSVLKGDTLEELAAELEKCGASRAYFIKMIREYNRAIDEGKAGELDPPRTGSLCKISVPPFYAVPVTAQIYHNMGGLAITRNAEVQDMHMRPIGGLYAVPPLAGGVWNVLYTGGIALAGTWGYIAGKSAVRYVKS